MAQTDDEPRRLNAPLVRALMWGAGMTTLEELATALGVDKSQLGRAYRGLTTPSIKMMAGFADRFPLAPFGALVRRAGDPGAAPAALGMAAEHLRDPEPQMPDRGSPTADHMDHVHLSNEPEVAEAG